MKRSVSLFLKTKAKALVKRLNGFGNSRQCYVCKRRFFRFTKFAGGSKAIPDFNRRLELVGSDVDNFGCLYCNSHDRERHLFMFFDKLGLWKNLSGTRVLHFAPEANLARRIMETLPFQYIRADLYSEEDGVEKIDATNIPFESNCFDFLIANHILEHIPDHRVALQEFHRVLVPGGIGILQTPYSRLLKGTFEDDNINTDELRLFFHGQKDHVRTFSECDLVMNIRDAGFEVDIIRHDGYFDSTEAYLYGVNRLENLIHVRKPVKIPPERSEG